MPSSTQTRWVILAVVLAPWAVIPAWLVFHIVEYVFATVRPANIADQFPAMELYFGIPIAYFLTVVFGLPIFYLLRARRVANLPILVLSGFALVVLVCLSIGDLKGVLAAIAYLGYFALWVSAAAWLLAVWIPQRRSNNAMDGDTVRSPLRAPNGARHRGR